MNLNRRMSRRYTTDPDSSSTHRLVDTSRTVYSAVADIADRTHRLFRINEKTERCSSQIAKEFFCMGISWKDRVTSEEVIVITGQRSIYFYLGT